jgi:peptidoglycan lytic transglycosylase B
MRVLLFVLIGLFVFGTPARANDQSFADWRADFMERAIAKGFDADLVRRTFADLTPDPEVLKRDGTQPEFTRTIADYLKGVLSEGRITQGRKMLAENADVFEKISAFYHIPPEVLSAVWGLESAYGRIQGNFDVIRSLATLAHDGRRKDWAEGELFAALQILTNGHASRDEMKGAWAGAMGQTQFLPSSYLAYAVDWDHDGRKDIWTSSADALASTANYLSRNGWRAGEPWGVEVQLPDGFPYALAEDTVLSIGSWSVRSAVRADHAIWSMKEQGRPAWLLLPAGYKGPAFLVSKNFHVFKKYNNSTAYALGVGLLSEVLAGRIAVRASWPETTPPLSRSQIKALQSALGKAGYSTGKPDGIAGPNTRRALRAFQAENGLVPDGYLDRTVFEVIQKKLANQTDAPVGNGQNGGQ